MEEHTLENIPYDNETEAERAARVLQELQDEYESIGYRRKLTKRHKVIRSEQAAWLEVLERVDAGAAAEIRERLGL